ncbi:class I SAM-dependent methyltransferase [Methylomonas koyamae]|uniref:class I SAM-dependent methyltransferase n=1 Tax=Methylomonas koyamae TaxID=702114 RepID=UPI000BC3116D|nr:class I SAM-dependent methyltransferase [Methylomonas koyamae]ATG91630.1 SAM-dependent methyltransferase [Methylomonas koyamae]
MPPPSSVSPRRRPLARPKSTQEAQPENLREYAAAWDDYELLDAGGGRKLERWGEVLTIRPEINAAGAALWPLAQWRALAHWEFVETSPTQGRWQRLRPDAPESWSIAYRQLRFNLKLTQFKHVGLFPEQQANWHFIAERVAAGARILNLFAYTGAASLVARAAGAEVTHVDSVRQMLDWANANQASSGLTDIKWVLEDALKFAGRELKRGKRYDGIVMDPPAWGLGANGEKWKLENQLPRLAETARGLLQPGGFLVLNTYSPKVGLQELAAAAGPHFGQGQSETRQLWARSRTGNRLYYGNLLRAVV